MITPEWTYAYLNASAAEQGRYSHDELLGQRMAAKYPGIERTRMFAKLRECMQLRTPQRVLNEFEFPDGSKGWFELKLEPVPEGVLILSFDVTPLKQVQADLEMRLKEQERLHEQIECQKKQLEDFCQVVAHNMRGPLTNLLLLVEFVEEAGTLEEKAELLEMQKPIVRYLLENFERLVELTQIKLDHVIQRERVDLEACVQATLALMPGELRESVAEIVCDFKEAGFVDYPQTYLDSIIFNLLSNALKYRAPTRPLKVQIRSYLKGGWVYLEVTDNGMGIDLGRHGPKMFQLRKTFHPHPDAKGFGLFMTKLQVEAAGGAISVESVPDEGSLFTVKLAEAPI